MKSFIAWAFTPIGIVFAFMALIVFCDWLDKR